MMNKLRYIVLILIIASCEFCNNGRDYTIKEDYIEIKKIIQRNPEFFQNERSEIPRVFYTSSLFTKDDFKFKEFESYSDFAKLLRKNNIEKIYISSWNEIWYVLSEEKRFLKSREYIVGYTGFEPVEKSMIMYYRPSQIQVLGDNWYFIVIDKSIID